MRAWDLVRLGTVASISIACGTPDKAATAPVPSAPASEEPAVFTEPAPTSNERWTLDVVDRAPSSNTVGVAVNETQPLVAFVPFGADHVALLTGPDWAARSGAEKVSSSIAFARDAGGKLHAVTSSRGVVMLRPIDKGKEEKIADLDATPLAVAFDAKGRAYACLGVNRSLRLASRDAGGPWSIAPITEDGSRCSIAPDDDGLVHVAYWSKGKAIVATKAVGEMQQATPDATATAVHALRGGDGKAIVLLGVDGQLVLARHGQNGWTKTPFGPTLGPIAAIVADVEKNGGVRAIVTVGSSRPGAKVALWSVQQSAGKAGASIVLQQTKAGVEPQVAIDASNEPHIAFVDDGKVIHARHKAKDDNAPRKVPTETFVQGCFDHIRDHIKGGAPASGFRPAKSARDCEWIREGVSPTRGMLEKQCSKDAPHACVVLGALLAPSGQLGPLRVDIRARACEPGRACESFYETKTALWAPPPDGKAPASDAAAAKQALETACDAIAGVGCLLRAELETDDAAAAKFFARACDATLPSACTAWLVRGAFRKSAELNLPHLRTELEQACKMESASSCNALGFMQEKPLGFKKAEVNPSATFQRGCELGSGFACSRIILGPGARPAPGKIEAEMLAASLVDLCDGVKDYEGCLALATAYDVGWAVPKDAERAKALYKQACDAGAGSACRKIAR